MCQYFSALIHNNKGKIEVLWDGRLTSHEDLIKKFHLKDDKLQERDFVRVELTPNEQGLWTQKRSDWKYHVDEEGTLPGWYRANERKAEKLAWDAVKDSIKPIEKNLKEAGEFIKSIKKIPYLKMNGKLKAEWHISFGKDISAAYSAARSAVDSAVDSAAYSAADSAARSAARSAVDSAADSAAYSAAYSAALKVHFIMVADLDFKGKAKHTATANAEMEVWQRGFGLITDIGGKLYVYAVGKKEDYKMEGD